MLDITKIVILFLTSIALTCISIALVARESRQYVLNLHEMGLVFFLSIMFTVWLIIANWNASNWYAVLILDICFSVLGVSFYIDLKLQELPDVVSIIVLACVVLLLVQPQVLAQGWQSFGNRFLMAATITAICFVFSIKTENLGMGDVKLLFPMLLMIGLDRSGSLQGYKIIYYLYNVLIPAFVVSIGYLVIYKNKNIKIAFGPYLILGFVLTFSVFPTSIFLV